MQGLPACSPLTASDSVKMGTICTKINFISNRIHKIHRILRGKERREDRDKVSCACKKCCLLLLTVL